MTITPYMILTQLLRRAIFAERDAQKPGLLPRSRGWRETEAIAMRTAIADLCRDENYNQALPAAERDAEQRFAAPLDTD